MFRGLLVCIEYKYMYLYIYTSIHTCVVMCTKMTFNTAIIPEKQRCQFEVMSYRILRSF